MTNPDDPIRYLPTERAWREWHEAKGLDCHDGGETMPDFAGEDMHPTEEASE